MSIFRSGLVCFVCVAAWCLTSCGAPLLLEEDANLVGTIVTTGRGLWSGDEEGPFQIHVKANLGDECGIIFTVDSRSEIVDVRGGEPRSASSEILTMGARVAVWHGAVLESCPGQSFAEAVERLD